MGLGVDGEGDNAASSAKFGSYWYEVIGSSVVPLQEWTLVTGVLNKDTQEYKIFLNGIVDGSTQIPDSTFAHPGLSAAIGAHMWLGGEYYTVGDIDEVIIYQRALTDSEILQIYNAGINNPPTTQDDTYEVNQDEVLTVPSLGVLANDVDPESDQLTALCVSTSINGDLLLYPDGSFTYTPLPDWYGNVTFTYKANDGIADSNEANVWITVNKLVPPTQYIINSTSVVGGSISPSSDTVVFSGEDQSFDLQFNKPYQIAVITIDDITIDLKNLVVTFNNVLSDHTIHAEFTSPGKSPK